MANIFFLIKIVVSLSYYSSYFFKENILTITFINILTVNFTF